MESRHRMGKTVSTRALAAALVAMMVSAAPGQTKSAAGPLSAPASPAAADKQKAAHADADRLLALAQELKTSVDKSRKDELNVQVIREAEEIEKLARSLRSRVQ